MSALVIPDYMAGRNMLSSWPAQTGQQVTHRQSQEWFFPLLLGDLNREFLRKIIIRLMTSHGLMILGKAGIGKTPVAQVPTL